MTMPSAVIERVVLRNADDAMDLDQAAQCSWFAKFRRDVLGPAGAPQ
jgi:hypothetical protein